MQSITCSTKQITRTLHHNKDACCCFAWDIQLVWRWQRPHHFGPDFRMKPDLPLWLFNLNNNNNYNKPFGSCRRCWGCVCEVSKRMLEVEVAHTTLLPQRDTFYSVMMLCNNVQIRDSVFCFSGQEFDVSIFFMAFLCYRNRMFNQRCMITFAESFFFFQFGWSFMSGGPLNLLFSLYSLFLFTVNNTMRWLWSKILIMGFTVFSF